VRRKDADRLAGLDEQRLVMLERRERAHDGIECGPITGRLSRSTVDDEVVGPLGHLRVEIVHQHAQGGLLRPALAGEGGASRRPNDASDGGHQGTSRTLRSGANVVNLKNEEFFT